jgi:hypothetical protein
MLHRRSAGALAASVLLALGLAACGGGGGDEPGHPDAGHADAASPPGPDAAPPDAGIAPPLRNAVALEDKELALQATGLLGIGKPDAHSCNDCHAPSRPLLVKWRDLGDLATSECLNDLAVASPASAKKMIDCLRTKPSDPTSTFSTAKLGWYSAAAHLDWFDYVFERAYGSDAAARFTAFRSFVGMPKGAHTPFTQAQFDIVGEWFTRGMPFLEQYLPDDPPPGDCTSDISPSVGTHVAEMKTAGWGAVNQEHHVNMFGCAGAATPKDCLASFPRASTTSYGTGWESLPGAKLRILKDTSYTSSYWTRSSADGRFVAHGGASDQSGYNATIIDLQTDKLIPTNAYYDPGFFPDNSAFIFQGGAAFTCNQSVLTAGPTHLELNEPGCSSTSEIGLYQHVGASLGGGDYWIVDSEFVSDDGGKDVTSADPEPYFPSDATVRLTPMVHTGSAYVPGQKHAFTAAYEGDTVISPSSRLLVSRLAGPNGKQRGYVLHKLVATPAAGGGYTITTPEIGRYCVQGAKPNFSFDERFMVTHHYVTDADAVELGYGGANDPAFQAYRDKGASNLYLIDITTGARTRITGMKPGQYALYPHFRSDGWIYFIVRTPGDNGEHIVASDAALVLAP